MRILATDITEKWQAEFLSKNLEGHEVIPLSESLSVEVAKDYPETECLVVFVTSPVTPEIFETLPKLKFVATRSTGYDHINLEVAKSRSVSVATVPFYGENTVAEHAMALLLSLARKLPQSFARIKEGKFEYEGLRGWDLKDKTLGVVGGGHIGIHVARMAVGFEMKVLVFDLHQDSALSAKVGFQYASLDDIYQQADIISLHLPLNEHTQHILNNEAFDKMKDGVYIINTARGGLIDSGALIEALKVGKVAGAGLDVLEGEDVLMDELDLIADPKLKDKMLTLLENHILMDMENVIVTPHNAFNSNEALARIFETTVANIRAFVAGEPTNLVTR